MQEYETFTAFVGDPSFQQRFTKKWRDEWPIKQLIRLPEVVEDTAGDYQIQRLPQYAMELAGIFHQFYAECRVIDENNKELTQARLALISAARIVLKNTLDLMGISAPEKM